MEQQKQYYAFMGTSESIKKGAKRLQQACNKKVCINADENKMWVL